MLSRSNIQDKLMWEQSRNLISERKDMYNKLNVATGITDPGRQSTKGPMSQCTPFITETSLCY